MVLCQCVHTRMCVFICARFCVPVDMCVCVCESDSVFVHACTWVHMVCVHVCVTGVQSRMLHA